MGSQDLKNFPFEFQTLHPEETAVLKENFANYYEFIRVGPKGYIVSSGYKNDADTIYNIPLKSDDVFVSSFPRSGTTWTQELVWLLTMNLDYKTARSIPLTRRYTFLEFTSMFQWNITKKMLDTDLNESNVKIPNQLNKDGPELLSTCPSPRFVKTHLPLSFLPPNTIDIAKMVYIARDPRDVAVSNYHQNKLFNVFGYKGDFKTYWKVFKKSLVLWSPCFDNVKEAWALRHHPNMLFLFYEELSEDLAAVVRRVASFLNKQLNEDQVIELCEHLSFNNFKKNNSVNYNEMNINGFMAPTESFIRKGKTGGWREYFDEEMTADAENWIAHNLRDTDLRFPHINY